MVFEGHKDKTPNRFLLGVGVVWKDNYGTVEVKGQPETKPKPELAKGFGIGTAGRINQPSEMVGKNKVWHFNSIMLVWDTI